MASTEDASTTVLTADQASEAAYRFVTQYCEREPIVPLMLMLVAMEPQADQYRTNDPASWADWMKCGSGRSRRNHGQLSRCHPTNAREVPVPRISFTRRRGALAASRRHRR
jgi:hypothetical protein